MKWAYQIRFFDKPTDVVLNLQAIPQISPSWEIDFPSSHCISSLINLSAIRAYFRVIIIDVCPSIFETLSIET